MSEKRLDDKILLDFVDLFTSDRVELMSCQAFSAYMALLWAQWRDAKLPRDERLLTLRASSGIRHFSVEEMFGGGSIEDPGPGSIWSELLPCFALPSSSHGQECGTESVQECSADSYGHSGPFNVRIDLERRVWLAIKDLGRAKMSLGSRKRWKKKDPPKDMLPGIHAAIQTLQRTQAEKNKAGMLYAIQEGMRVLSAVESYVECAWLSDTECVPDSVPDSVPLSSGSYSYSRERETRARARDSLSLEAPDGAGTKAAGEDLEAAGLTEELWTQRVTGCPKAKSALAWIAELQMAKEAAQAYGGKAVRELYRLAVAGGWVEVPWDRLDRITARREANGGNGSTAEEEAPTVTRQAAEAFFERERERMLAESPPDHREDPPPGADIEDDAVDAEELARRREQAGRNREALLKAAGVATEADEAEEQDVEPNPDPSAAKVSKAKRYKKLSESTP